MAHILAVDDSEPIRKLIHMVLTNAGHMVDLACDGIEGLQCFQQRSYQLVITDINMPRMDGIEFIREIRNLSLNIPILALTTEWADNIRERGTEAGANGWIIKPFKPEQFRNIVRQIAE